MSEAERYVRLGLRLDRHVEGLVDAYFGPPELKAEVEAEAPADPRALVAEAESLLDELADGWLRDQVAGLRTYAGVLAGEPVPYADEVERCYGVRPEHTDESVFHDAHQRLDELLPGDGRLARRYEGWRESTRVPSEHVEQTVEAMMEEARAWTRGLVELPAGEGVELEIVRDRPWLAFCHYLGGLRSRISVNADLALSAIELLRLTLHETYPGHHAERACKENLLVRERGLLEESVVLVPTPQSLVSEGIAELAPLELLESDSAAALAGVLRDVGIDLDLTHALTVERAAEPLRRVEVNAALMLYEGGAGDAELHAYLQRWGLMSPEYASHLLRFFAEPTSRAYIVTYAAGVELCRAYAAGRRERLRRLLTEQVRVDELLAERER